MADFAWAGFIDADLNQDGIVDYLDVHEISSYWLNDCFERPCFNIDTKQDDFIDFYDFAYLSGHWQNENFGSYQIAHWTFDEGSGSIAYDSTQNNHDAQLRNMSSYSWTSGQRQGALYFDGNNDYVSVYELDNGLGQYFERDFSIAVWVNQYAPQSDYQTIIGIESTSRFTTNGFEGFTIETYNGVPSIYIAYEDEQREIVPTTVPLQPDQWQHLCVVREGSVVRIYIDGKLDTSRIITDANIKFGSVWPGYDVIGATNDSWYGVTGRFRGKLDDIHLYNFAIPESLIQKLAQQDYAWLPEPENESANVSTDAKLSWQKGLWPQDYDCHDVYLGTDYNEVFAADTNTIQIYRTRQTSRLYDPCGLQPDTFYYWRIDDINGQQVHKGDVWSFKVSDLVSSIEASSSQSGFDPYGAYDGFRFEGAAGKCWKGQPGEADWFWQINFSMPRQIGAILMIMGEPGEPADELRFFQRKAPADYKWQYSSDAIIWHDLSETIETQERRLFRIHRLDAVVVTQHLRLQISGCVDNYPTIREIEVYSETDADIAFDDWLVAVDITEGPEWPHGNTQWFIELARECSGWENVQGQQIWLGNFDESFLNVEPYPLCVFLSGSYQEWCQRTRIYFAGLQEVVVNGNIPIWGSCGGAQVLGILLDTGYQNPWDCPRCRLQHNPPYSPIYGYIGYINPAIEPGPCGEYTNNIAESGPYLIAKVTSDPVFNGLSNPFYAYESHVGQLEYLPSGWHQIGGPGLGTLTELQCFRRDDRYIYGAAFHIENYNATTWDNSKQIMTNFLGLAQSAGGYQPSE